MTDSQRKIMIAPSILSADFTRLGEEIREVVDAGCDLIHVDVMDGHFVPNLTIGAPVVQWIRKTTVQPLDVHLMIDKPERYVEDFRRAGSDMITIHVESTAPWQVHKTLKHIREMGAKAGISLRPKTPVKNILPYLEDCDLVLVMTVEPGFGGQSFMPDMMNKIRDLRPRFTGLISVDGGINRKNAVSAIQAGADILVAGTSVFGEKNRAEAIQALRNSGPAA